MVPIGKTLEGKTSYKTELKDLIDRGFISMKHPIHGYVLDNLQVTKLFTENFIDDISIAPEQFFEAYPKTIIVSGVEYPARSCDFDEMSIAYLKAIKGSIRKHRMILDQLSNQRQVSPYAQSNIMKYIGGRAWEGREDVSVSRNKIV